jgi:hypothetical protein
MGNELLGELRQPQDLDAFDSLNSSLIQPLIRYELLFEGGDSWPLTPTTSSPPLGWLAAMIRQGCC